MRVQNYTSNWVKANGVPIDARDKGWTKVIFKPGKPANQLKSGSSQKAAKATVW